MAWPGQPTPATSSARCRPGDAGWPTEGQWQELRLQVGGRLLKPRSPLETCLQAPGSAACTALLESLKNPYFLGDEVGLTQTLAWVDAWSSKPSTYAVAARTTKDVVAAVNFARQHNLRLVVKGGGHSYQGTSNAPDSLLIWTRKMNEVTLHDAFVGTGCEGRAAPMRAATIGAGAVWAQAYDAVTTRGGGYVQGGGCMTVGVAGLVQSGGFGSFSKAYGLAAGSLLQAEVVTADGVVRIANACTNPDLFWGLKGGGGGSLGVVTRLDAARSQAAGRFRCGQHDDPGHIGARVPQVDRPDDGLLQPEPAQPALGRTDPLSPGQLGQDFDGVPGARSKSRQSGLAAVPGLARPYAG